MTDPDDDLAQLLANASPAFRKRNARVLEPTPQLLAGSAPAVVPAGDGRSEAVWQAVVVKFLNRYGWLWYHTHNSRHSPSGYPDIAAVQLVTSERPRAIFAELKTNARTSRPTPTQRVWLGRLAAAGLETYLWRPTDETEVEQILRGDPPPHEGWGTAWLAD